MKRLAFILTLAVTMGCGGDSEVAVSSGTSPDSSTASAGNLMWHDSESGAIAKASAEQLPLMVDFTADWCMPCRVLDEEVFQAPEVAFVLHSDFVLLRIDLSGDWDTPEKNAMREKYGVENLPAVRLLSAAGEALGGVDQLVSTAEFLELLDKARS